MSAILPALQTRKARARLLALAELIEEKQGFGWLLAEDLAEEAS